MRHWWIAACLLIVLWACTPRPARAPGGGAEKPSGIPARKQTAPPPPARPALPPVSAEQALLALPAARLLPEDFQIGPLGDALSGSRGERQARAAAVRFLAGLAEGKVPAEELLPGRREELQRSLQYYLDRSLLPTRSRLGPLAALEDGSLRCRVRLFGQTGVAVGELYLSPQEAKWFVSDAQVGLPALAEPYARRQEKFVPSEVP